MDEVLRLTELQRLRLNWLAAETRASAAEAERDALALSTYLARVDPQGTVAALQGRIAEARSRRVAVEADYRAACSQIRDALGLTGDLIYDDQTGIVRTPG